MRGAAGIFPLDAETVKIVGASLASQIKEKKQKPPKFVIGRDTRESGSWLETAFCEGATSQGAECISAEIITTPAVAFLTKYLKADAGIVVSASHNPFEDNGIKIFTDSGRKLDEATESLIEKDIHDAKFDFPSSNDVTKSEFNFVELQNIYLDYLANEFENLRLDDLKIVVDCANGAASNLAPRLFERLGAKVTAIYDKPNGRNINDDCGSLHLDKLQSKVLTEKAGFGVAFDGDADRALFVDGNGNLVDGDATLWAMANFLQNRGELKNATVVATVMSNLGLEVALKSKNINLVRAKVGDKYVLEELLKTKSTLGGEQSGHIIFPDKSLVGDGIFTALSLLEAMQTNKSSLAELTNGFTQFPQILINVKVREKLPFESVPKIAAAARDLEDELGTRGRLVLRYSGTESLARVMIEGEHQEIINAQAEGLAAIIKEELQ